MSDTPETHADEAQQSHPYNVVKHGGWSRARKLERERNELQNWKAQAIEVENEWNPQAVANLLGIKVGHSIRRNIEPKICKLINERDDARNLAAEIALGITHSPDCSESIPCMRCQRDALREKNQQFRELCLELRNALNAHTDYRIQHNGGYTKERILIEKTDKLLTA